jgi:hypothetical protein
MAVNDAALSAYISLQGYPIHVTRTPYCEGCAFVIAVGSIRSSARCFTYFVFGVFGEVYDLHGHLGVGHHVQGSVGGAIGTTLQLLQSTKWHTNRYIVIGVLDMQPIGGTMRQHKHMHSPESW